MTVPDPLSVVTAFGAAWGAHDIDGVLACCADDVVFESTTPPDGERFIGQDAVRAVWGPVVASTGSRFDLEETIVAGDRVVQRCRYSWGDGHVQLVDVFRVANGKVAEKLTYVKG
ncbi:MAG: nuclear transport factor 2 family protein [Acidimicrobiia bacterium]